MFDGPINPLATSLFGLTCLLLGVALALALRPRPRNRPDPLPPLDWYEEDAIDQGATAWAQEQGRPHVAGIAASYLKLGTRLQRRHTGSPW